MNSWFDLDFRGDAAKALLKTISVYLVQQKVYAQHAVIVNSSGTGKSRMVDELAKTIITVPMCLRGPKSSGWIYYCSRFTCTFNMLTGYPPSDKALRKWLLSMNRKDQKDVAKLLHGFLTSLLDVTLERLKAIEDGDTLYNCSGNQDLTVLQILQCRSRSPVCLVAKALYSDTSCWRTIFVIK